MNQPEPLLLDTADGQHMLTMTRAFDVGGQVHAVVASAPASGGDCHWYLFRCRSAGRWEIIGPIESEDGAVGTVRQDALTDAHPEVARWAETQSSLLLAPARTAWPDSDATPEPPPPGDRTAEGRM